MKKVSILFAFLLIGSFAHAQMFTYGPTANFGVSTYRAGDNISDPGTSYGIGGFARAKLLMLYVQPEVQYQYLSSPALNSTFSMHRIDVPINVGWKFLMFDINAGPVVHFPLAASAGDLDASDGLNPISTSIQFGAGVELGPIHVGARYQAGVSDVYDSGIETRWRQYFAFIEYQL